MKTCSLCQKAKPLFEFNKRKAAKDGHQARCRACNKLSLKKHYGNNKLYYSEKRKSLRSRIRVFLEEMKQEFKCALCGECEPCCLDFHHVDESKKAFNIAEAANSGISKSRILKEVAKCVVVCSNCHRKIHAGICNCPIV